ncbi:MAG: carbohydrate binding family 9 domain-containing protein, partial [Acidobacteriota bacterium]
MRPSREIEGKMTKVTGFTQRLPRDGQPVSQRTEAYLAYDDKHFYAVFLNFDTNPELIRGRMTPRESFRGDDKVDLFLDTFHDERRGYVFTVNPLGVQMDGRWTESRAGGNFDSSFNALWHSKAKITDQGWIAWMEIPLKSLRFPSRKEQEWGIVIIRWIPRNNESSTWPWASTRIEGRLNQGATLLGIEDISPGRSIQLIPFGFMRSYRVLDTRNPEQAQFVTDRFEPDAGLDAKVVLKDSLVLDMAVNPDFSQVESDEPQVTVNQRFEVFFPERRPFFLENADFFETPIRLFFSRRIADPQFGVRLTGKQGPYAIGALFADDQAPGKAVLPEDPLSGSRAKFAVLRVNRDLFREATLGVLFTDREYENGFNRVAAVDTRFKLSPNWSSALQAAASSTRFQDGETQTGPAFLATLRREGRQFVQTTEYSDISPDFRTETGFVRRTNIRSISHEAEYQFRPEGDYLVAWGPSITGSGIWDHEGTRLDWQVETQLSWEFIGPTSFGLFYTPGRERLRPEDFNSLTESIDFSRQAQGVFFNSQYFSQFNIQGRLSFGREINLVPPAGEKPSLAAATAADLVLTWRPNEHLRNDNTYILSRLTSLDTNESIFNNHIFRSKWNWQFNREFALRIILQYDTILA